MQGCEEYECLFLEGGLGVESTAISLRRLICSNSYLHVFSIRAPYVREKPISLNQTRSVHV
jgi:hypothetical protein